jgi:drug/metabolite transporter (DMT)-like permease
MMRGLIVLVTAAMSMIFLGKKQYRHHYLSLLTIVLGIVLVGYASLTKEDTGNETKTKPLGIILILIA